MGFSSHLPRNPNPKRHNGWETQHPPFIIADVQLCITKHNSTKNQVNGLINHINKCPYYSFILYKSRDFLGKNAPPCGITVSTTGKLHLHFFHTFKSTDYLKFSIDSNLVLFVGITKLHETQFHVAQFVRLLKKDTKTFNFRSNESFPDLQRPGV